MAAKKKQFKREKKVLVFDENSRREYLLGFRKRKNERRKKAKEDLMKKEKDRKKELKVEKKKALVDQMEKQRKELDALESDHESGNEGAEQSVDATYDHPEHVVTVTTISDVSLDSDKFACIGPNKGLPETVLPSVSTTSDLQDQHDHKTTRTNKKTTSKRHKFHKKLKKKRTNTHNEDKQDGPTSGRTKKRKNFHSNGKSKHFKKS